MEQIQRERDTKRERERETLTNTCLLLNPFKDTNTIYIQTNLEQDKIIENWENGK